jgi:flagellar protein FlbT
MKGSLRIFLRPGEKVFLNGAVLRADRKVSLEVLNNVSFLLENHVMQAYETTTPLRQLYFIIQTILIDPASAQDARELFRASHSLMMNTVTNRDLLAGLQTIEELMREERTFETLKVLRQLFAVEQDIMAAGAATKMLEREAV